MNTISEQALRTCRVYQDLKRCDENIKYSSIEIRSYQNRIERLQRSLELSINRLEEYCSKKNDIQSIVAEEYRNLYVIWSKVTQTNSPKEWEEYCSKQGLPYYEVWHEDTRALDL